MIMISCQHIKKYHAANLVLEDVTFEIHEGERTGIIGPNGSGKTTMLKIMAGLEHPDGGQLFVKRDARIGYLTQLPESREGMTVYDSLALGCVEVLESGRSMRRLEEAMSRPETAEENGGLERLLKQYALEQERFERGGGYEMDARIARIAAGLGIGQERFGQTYSTLSGGEKTKVSLASLLVAAPDILLLDEPTNHLDLAGIEWLEEFLRDYKGTCVTVSHDRYFLDRIVTRIVEVEDGEAALYETGYSGYVQEKEARLLRQFADYQEQQKVIRKMKETIRQLEEWGRIGANEKFFRRAASMQKALDRMEKVKRPVLDPRTARFEWKQEDRSGRRVAVLDNVEKGYGVKKVLDSVSGMLEFGEKSALLGGNGAGKTTLFKLLLGLEQPDAGSITLGARVEAGYLAQEESPVDGKQTVLDYFRREARMEEGEARGRLAGYLFYGAAVFKPLSGLSGGEWTRLRLAVLVHGKPNFLLLDEPTNHLDIPSREALEETLEQFPGTILAISHDRYFVNRLAGRVLELEAGRLTAYIGGYDDYRNKKRELGEVCEHQNPSVSQTGAAQRQEWRQVDGSQEKRQKNGRQGDGREGGKQEKQQESAGQGKKQEKGRGEKRENSRKGRMPEDGGLEQQIAALEQQLERVDQLLAESSDAGAEGGYDRLAGLWEEQEQLRATLESLYEEWLLLSEE